MDIPCLVPQLNHQEKTLPLDPPTPQHVPVFSVVHHIGRWRLASARTFSLFIQTRAKSIWSQWQWRCCLRFEIESQKQKSQSEKISDVLNIPKFNVIDICRIFSYTRSVENKPRSGQPKKIKPQDYQQLERILQTNRRSLLSNISTKFSERRPDRVSKRTTQYNLHIKHHYWRSVVIKKLIIKRCQL